MKLRVQHEGDPDRIEILTLVPPLSIHLSKRLNYIRDTTGMIHWFTPDGYYDGWSRSVGSGPDQVMEGGFTFEETIDLINSGREFEEI